MMNRLSPKQESFVQNYIKSGNATQSYLDAGYNTKSPDVGASQLLRNNSIIERLDELKKLGEEEFKIDKAFLTEKYLEIHEKAMEGSINVSKGALDSLARMWGVNEADKVDLTTKGDKLQTIDYSALSEEALKEIANAPKSSD
jgi:phage terminase small subunit